VETIEVAHYRSQQHNKEHILELNNMFLLHTIVLCAASFSQHTGKGKEAVD